jgi:hypothetical protein
MRGATPRRGSKMFSLFIFVTHFLLYLFDFGAYRARKLWDLSAIAN